MAKTGSLANVLKVNLSISFMTYKFECLKLPKILYLTWRINGRVSDICCEYQDTVTRSHSGGTRLTNPGEDDKEGSPVFCHS